MAMTPLPPAPQRTDAPEVFATKADTFVAALPGFVTEANALQTDVTNKQTTASTAATTATTQATNAATSATNAATSATTASNWAIKVGSVVSGSDWSAKEHAVGTAVTTGSAKDWATKTSGTVAGTDYSAKYYSQVAQTAAAAAQSAAGLPSLTGNAGKVLTVNSTSNGVVWSSSAAVVGTVIQTADTLSAPDWLPCNGSTYLQSTYPALYAKVGTLISKDGHTGASTSVGGTGSAAYGGGRWVVVSSGTSVSVSTNGGTSWTSYNHNIAGLTAESVAYGNGVFVLVGYGSGTDFTTTVCATSSDGITWTQRTIPTGRYYTVAYGSSGGGFYAVGHTSTGSTTSAASSPDGITWTQRTMPLSSTWKFVSHSDGYFIFVAGSGAIARSNQLNSPALISQTSLDCRAISSSPDMVVVLTNGDRFLYSLDRGGVWRVGLMPTLTTPQPWLAVCYMSATGGWLAAAAGSQKAFAYSIDGVSWKMTNGDSNPTSANATGIATDGSQFLCLASGTSRFVNPYGYSTSTSFATPVINPSTNGGVKTYIRAT